MGGMSSWKIVLFWIDIIKISFVFSAPTFSNKQTETKIQYAY